MQIWLHTAQTPCLAHQVLPNLASVRLTWSRLSSLPAWRDRAWNTVAWHHPLSAMCAGLPLGLPAHHSHSWMSSQYPDSTVCSSTGPFAHYLHCSILTFCENYASFCLSFPASWEDHVAFRCSHSALHILNPHPVLEVHQPNLSPVLLINQTTTLLPHSRVLTPLSSYAWAIV